MSASNTVQEINRQLAHRINEETRRDPHSPYVNKFVGIVDGQVVVVADDADELGRRLREIEADPRKCFCFWVDPSQDYDEAHEIWGLH